MKNLTNHSIRQRIRGSGSKRLNQLSLYKDGVNSTNFNSTNNVQLDAENNNIQSSKCKIIRNHKIINNIKETVVVQESSRNIPGFENIVTKIEITEHGLEENIEAPELIHNNYSEIIAYDNSISEESSNIEVDAVKEIELNRVKLRNKKKSPKRLTLDEIIIKKKKRKYVDRRKPPKKIEGLEQNEKLFIRLVRLDISGKLNMMTDNIDPVTTNNSSNICEVEESQKKPLKAEFLPKLERATKKVSKTELQKQNLVNINKTESLRMEQELLQKFKKAKERQVTEDSLVEVSEQSTNEFEPYVYEKTSKSVYETYELKAGENGQMILQCLLCPFTGERFKQMSLHYKFKHRDTPIEEMHFCNVKDCNFKSVHKAMFKWHMRRHMLAADKLILGLYPCTQCDRVFDQRKGFLIHLKHMHMGLTSVPNQNDFPCATCKFRTTSKQNLQAHIYRSHVPNNIKPKIKCGICGFETPYRNVLKKHLTQVHLNND